MSYKFLYFQVRAPGHGVELYLPGCYGSSPHFGLHALTLYEQLDQICRKVCHVYNYSCEMFIIECALWMRAFACAGFCAHVLTILACVVSVRCRSTTSTLKA